MTRRADIVRALRENPTAFADRLGFPLLTDLHRDWCREMVRGSYIINPQLIGYGTNANVDNLSRIYGTFRIDRDGATVEPVFVGENK